MAESRASKALSSAWSCSCRRSSIRMMSSGVPCVRLVTAGVGTRPMRYSQYPCTLACVLNLASQSL